MPLCLTEKIAWLTSAAVYIPKTIFFKDPVFIGNFVCTRNGNLTFAKFTCPPKRGSAALAPADFADVAYGRTPNQNHLIK